MRRTSGGIWRGGIWGEAGASACVDVCNLRHKVDDTMNKAATSVNKPKLFPRWLFVGLCASGVTSGLAIAAMIFKAVEMVRIGRGLEAYRTFWLVEYNWIGFLVLVGGVLVALLLGAVWRWNDRRQWRELEEKYEKRASDA